MPEPLAFLDGQWIPATAAAIPVSDAGFVLGATVAEQLRTFAGKLFHLDEHLARLAHSLEIIGVDPGMTADQFAATAQELVARNHALLDPGDDLGLSILVTPGDYPAFSECVPTYSPRLPGEGQSRRSPLRAPTQGWSGEGQGVRAKLPESRPTVCLHTYPLPFRLWAGKYRSGQALITTDVQQVPPQCWPASLKCRSRMHYYLADRQAAAVDPEARALLLDAQGFVSETSTANLLIYKAGEGLISPPATKILRGISLSVAMNLFQQLGPRNATIAADVRQPTPPHNTNAAGYLLRASERDLTVADVGSADEAFLTSTPLCLLPVVRLNGRPIGAGRPGELFHRLIAAWSDLAGVDIIAQAERFSTRNTS